MTERAHRGRPALPLVWPRWIVLGLWFFCWVVPSPSAQAKKNLRQWGPKTMIWPQSFEIPIIVHLFSKDWSWERRHIENGVRKLNQSFQGTGIGFFLHDIRHHSSKADNWITSYEEMDRVRARYSVKPHRYLNVFVVRHLRNGKFLWGNGTFPWAFAKEFNGKRGEGQYHPSQGIILERIAGLNWTIETPVFPHEVGHYLGLYHTFQGGPEEKGDKPQKPNGDYVDDTPCQRDEHRSCNYTDNSCDDSTDKDGADPLDPIGNYMTYIRLLFECRDHFSEGQIWRMRNAILRYRYELLPGREVDLSGLNDKLSGPVKNGFIGARKKVYNSGPAVVGPQSEVTIEVYNRDEEIVLSDGFVASRGCEFEARVIKTPPRHLHQNKKKVGRQNRNH